MENFLFFLDANSGALMVIFTAFVTLSTVVYAILTASLVIETRKMRQVQTEPKIEVVVKPSDEHVEILTTYVRNIGLGPAYGVTFTIDIESGEEGATKLIDDFTVSKFFHTGLKYLSPGQQVHSYVSSMAEMYEEKIKAVINISVHYKSISGKSYAETYRLDFGEFDGYSQFGKPSLYAIANSLEKIQKDINKLVAGSRIKTDIYTSRDRDVEMKEREERYEELRSQRVKSEMKNSSQNDALERKTE